MKANDPNALLARDANEAARAWIPRCWRRMDSHSRSDSDSMVSDGTAPQRVVQGDTGDVTA